MYCPNCGKLNENSALNFCSNCGRPLKPSIRPIQQPSYAPSRPSRSRMLYRPKPKTKKLSECDKNLKIGYSISIISIIFALVFLVIAYLGTYSSLIPAIQDQKLFSIIYFIIFSIIGMMVGLLSIASIDKGIKNSGKSPFDKKGKIMGMFGTAISASIMILMIINILFYY